MKLNKVRIAFGRTVASQREVRGLSQQDLANLIGVTQVTICKIETGKQGTPLETALVLSKYLGFSIDKIPLHIRMVET